MELYADENMPAAAVAALRIRHDVYYPQELGDKGGSDSWHLREAARLRRALVTVDYRDFRFIHRVLTTVWNFDVLEAAHNGILTVTHQPDFDEWLRAIEELVARRTEFSGRLFVWNTHTRNWDEDDWRPER